MTKIDFYILPETDALARLQFVCRVIEKAYKQKHRIYVHTHSKTEANQMDELLWTYREDSFLPHNLYGDGPDPAPPIQIGFAITPEKQHDILINLTAETPLFYTQFKRMLEIIPSDTAAQTAARERYRTYRTQGHDIQTHKLQTIES